MGRKEYLQLICESLVREYGGTLVDGDTDLIMAKAVLRSLRPYLRFSQYDLSDSEFKAWREEFTENE